MNTLKILEKNIPCDMESRINEMIQAQESIELYKTRVIQPFETRAKELAYDVGSVVYDSEIRLQVIESERATKPNAKDLVERLEGHLQAALTNQAAKKQMYGVRRFNGVVAIDASYLLSELEEWSKPTGTTTSTAVQYKRGSDAAAIKELATTHCGRLATVAYNQPDFSQTTLSRDDVALYVAACEQVALLGKHKVKPVMDLIKKTAKPKQDQTTFDRCDYGEFTTQVMTVPRYESNHAAVLKTITQTLEQAMSANQDNATLFYNAHLEEPRMYVSIAALQTGIQDGLSVQYRRQKQEISVLHKPEKAMILALE